LLRSGASGLPGLSSGDCWASYWHRLAEKLLDRARGKAKNQGLATVDFGWATSWIPL